jgi:tetratricopeptide (TPR) repeat protein
LRYASNLALLYSDMGQFEQALVLTQQVLDAKRRVLGEDNPSTLATTINLALLHTRTGDFQACAELCGPLIQRARRVYGESHTHTLTSRGLLATAYLGMGRSAQAETIFREVLQQRQAAQPSEPVRVAIALSQHGEALGALRRFEEAEPELLEGHRLLQEALGDAHTHTQQAAARVREFYDRWGRPQQKAAWETSPGG